MLSICVLMFVPQKGFTPLHLAARQGHEEVVRYLAANGAAINHADEVNNMKKECWNFVVYFPTMSFAMLDTRF